MYTTFKHRYFNFLILLMSSEYVICFFTSEITILQIYPNKGSILFAGICNKNNRQMTIDHGGLPEASLPRKNRLIKKSEKKS